MRSSPWRRRLPSPQAEYMSPVGNLFLLIMLTPFMAPHLLVPLHQSRVLVYLLMDHRLETSTGRPLHLRQSTDVMDGPHSSFLAGRGTRDRSG